MSEYKITITNGGPVEWIDPDCGEVVQGTERMFGVSRGVGLSTWGVDHIPTGRRIRSGPNGPIKRPPNFRFKFQSEFLDRESAIKAAKTFWDMMTEKQKKAFRMNSFSEISKRFPKAALRAAFPEVRQDG